MRDWDLECSLYPYIARGDTDIARVGGVKSAHARTARVLTTVSESAASEMSGKMLPRAT